MGLLAKADDGQKPLFRKYAARIKKAGGKQSEIVEIVESIRLSSSEEWIIIECQHSVAMLNALSKAGTSFWELVTQFNGEMRALSVVFAHGKLGYDVEPHPTESGHWTYNEEEEKVIFTDGEIKKTSTGLDGLSLESMTLPSLSVNAQTQLSNTTRVRAGKSQS
jgi:hypothetical protein